MCEWFEGEFWSEPFIPTDLMSKDLLNFFSWFPPTDCEWSRCCLLRKKSILAEYNRNFLYRLSFFFLETIDLFLRAHKKHRNRNLKEWMSVLRIFFHNYLVTLDFNILLGFHVEKFKQKTTVPLFLLCTRIYAVTWLSNRRRHVGYPCVNQSEIKFVSMTFVKSA